MINIEYERSALRLTVSGHACCGAEGEDIVCAAASMLLCALAENARRLCVAMPKDYRLSVLRLDKGAGELRVEAERGRAVAELIFDAFVTGFEMLAGKYPQRVKMTVGRDKN